VPGDRHGVLAFGPIGIGADFDDIPSCPELHETFTAALYEKGA
jgi:hypothetical protein